MGNPKIVDLFVEDHAHEAFMSALVSRLARELECRIEIRVRTARGGHGRVLEELTLYQRVLSKNVSGFPAPDIIVIVVDTNCSAYSEAVSGVKYKVQDDYEHRTVVACPDPHIEAWYMSDLPSFHSVIGIQPQIKMEKCERDYYKHALKQSVIKGGHAALLGGIEFAAELVTSMDLYRAGKAHPSLKHAIDEIRRSLSV